MANAVLTNDLTGTSSEACNAAATVAIVAADAAEVLRVEGLPPPAAPFPVRPLLLLPSIGKGGGADGAAAANLKPTMIA